MTQGDVIVAFVAAAVTVGLLYQFLVNRSDSKRDAIRDLKLFANVGLIMLWWGLFIAVAALVAYAYWTKQWNYALVAFVVMGLGLRLLGDIDIRHRRSRGLYSETADLLRERSGEKKPDSPFTFTFKTDGGEGFTIDPSSLPPEMLAELPPDVAAKLKPEDLKAKTYTMSFSFGRHTKTPR